MSQPTDPSERAPEVLDAAAPTSTRTRPAGSIGVDSAESAAPDVIADGVTRGRRRGVLIAASVLAVALVGGGAALAAGRLSGGGPQPDEAVPATALAFVSVDLDPSAGQKLDALRFLRRFPDASARLGGGDDPRRALFEQLTKDGHLTGDWAVDVQPWLGQRAGAALLPPVKDGGDPGVVVVLAVTDATKARAGLAKVGGGGAPCTVTDEFAVCSDSAQVASQAVADARTHPLSGLTAYSGDLRALGGRGIARAWVDLTQVSKNLPSGSLTGADPSGTLGGLGSGLGGDVTGRAAFTVRFDGPNLRLDGAVTGSTSPALTGTADVDGLPTDTIAALGVGRPDVLFGQAWRAVRAQLGLLGAAQIDPAVAAIKQQYGVSLPGDVQRALGAHASVVLGGQKDGAPLLAAELGGDRGVLDTLIGAVTKASAEAGAGPVAIATSDAGSGTVVASDAAFADAVAKGSGLGGTAAFQAAVPGARDAQVVGFVDITKLIATMGPTLDLTASEQANLAPLQALGVSVKQDGATVRYTVRITTK